MVVVSQAAVRVQGLKKRYGKTVALDGLDFEIPAGKLTGFLGPNGAGKTTTFRALLGLTRPDEGQVEVLEMSVPAQLREITKRVGAIVEEPGMLKALSGKVNLRVAADTLGFGHDRIEEMLEFVGLTVDSSRRVSEYSKGMRQRLALAGALLGQPDLLLFDEPLDGLDPAGQHVFKARLRALAEEGRTVVISSHDLSDIEALADHVVVIDHGVLVTEGPLDELLSGSGTRVLIADPQAALALLEGAGLAAHLDRDGVVVDSDDGEEIVRLLAGAGLYPSQVRPERTSLESVFLGITGR